MVAHVFVLARLTCIYVEVHNLRVDILSVLERANEGTNVLKSSASHELRSWVFQESVVNSGELVSLLLNLGNFGNFSNLVSTRFSDALFLVKSESFVEREYLLVEEVERYDLGNVKQVFGNGNTHSCHFVHSQRVYFWHKEALSQSLTHILGKLIQNF